MAEALGALPSSLEDEDAWRRSAAAFHIHGILSNGKVKTELQPLSVCQSIMREAAGAAAVGELQWGAQVCCWWPVGGAYVPDAVPRERPTPWLLLRCLRSVALLTIPECCELMFHSARLIVGDLPARNAALQNEPLYMHMHQRGGLGRTHSRKVQTACCLKQNKNDNICMGLDISTAQALTMMAMHHTLLLHSLTHIDIIPMPQGQSLILTGCNTRVHFTGCSRAWRRSIR